MLKAGCVTSFFRLWQTGSDILIGDMSSFFNFVAFLYVAYPEYTDFKEYFQDSLCTSVYQILKKNFASDCLILNAECDLGRVELSHDDESY